MFAEAVFPILNISASFLHPKFGLPLAKSKNFTFSSSDKAFLLSLPAVLWKWHTCGSYILKQAFASVYISNSHKENIINLTFDFAFDCKKLKIHGLFLWNSIKHVDLWDFVKKHWWENQRNLFEDTMHIWTYELQTLVMKICI